MNNKEKMPYKKNEKGLCLTPYWYLLKLMSWLWNVSNSIYVGLALMVNTLPANEEEVKDTGSIPASGRSPGEGNDNPLQYSCLGNPMDRETWQAVVHRVTNSWTLLKRLSMHARSFLYGSTLTSIHDHRKNHSFDYTDFCLQIEVSAF